MCVWEACHLWMDDDQTVWDLPTGIIFDLLVCHCVCDFCTGLMCLRFLCDESCEFVISM